MVRTGAKEVRPPDLGDQLRQAIEHCGLSLCRLAEATGVNKAQLSRFLRRERSLNLTAIVKLCHFLGLYLTGPGLEKKERTS